MRKVFRGDDAVLVQAGKELLGLPVDNRIANLA